VPIGEQIDFLAGTNSAGESASFALLAKKWCEWHTALMVMQAQTVPRWATAPLPMTRTAQDGSAQAACYGQRDSNVIK
jgi:hypothetical protein